MSSTPGSGSAGEPARQQELEVIEHGETRAGRRLRRDRVRIALVIALVEGLLVIAGIIPWWFVIGLAGITLFLYLYKGRYSPRAEVHETSWIAAFSQLSVVLVPVLVIVVGAVAVVILVLLAVVAIAVLLADRR